MHLGAKRRYINTLPFLSFPFYLSVCHDRQPAKTAEPIEMSFGMWTRVDPRNHALGQGAIWRIRLNRTRAAAMQPFCQITLTTYEQLLFWTRTQKTSRCCRRRWQPSDAQRTTCWPPGRSDCSSDDVHLVMSWLHRHLWRHLRSAPAAANHSPCRYSTSMYMQDTVWCDILGNYWPLKRSRQSSRSWCVCVSLCPGNYFELDDLWSRNLAHWFNLTLSRSSSKVNVISQS